MLMFHAWCLVNLGSYYNMLNLFLKAPRTGLERFLSMDRQLSFSDYMLSRHCCSAMVTKLKTNCPSSQLVCPKSFF